MATRVGIDPIGVDEVQDALATHGGRYLDRVFTDEERRECGPDAQRLATRFAAKEATTKTLDRGNEAIAWRSIGVRRAVSGRPVLELTGAAAGLARRHGIAELSVRFINEVSSAAVVLAQEGHDDLQREHPDPARAFSACSASRRRRLAHRSDGPLVMVEPE